MPSDTQWNGYSTGPAGGAPAVPPTSPSPAAGGTYFAPPPGTDQAAEGYTAANLAYQRALARYSQQRTGLLQQYGYKGTVDPNTGLMTNIGVDAGNSYGALQQLLHGQANEDQQAEFAAQDRGLVGGLAHQGEQELAYGHHGQSSALANSLFGSLSDVNSQQLDAKDTLDQALWQLQHGATTDAIGGGDWNPADVGPDAGGDGSGSGAGGAGGGHHPAISRIGTVPTTLANKLVKKAVAKGEPVSEHGLGQMKSPTGPPVRGKAPATVRPNAYITNKKKRG